MRAPLTITRKDRRSDGLDFVDEAYRHLRGDVETVETQISNLGWYNVKDYGATGDGVTDDAAAIQAAIDVVETNGGVIYFPVGTYYINRARLIYNSTKPVAFIGSAWNSKLDWNYATDTPAQDKGMLNIYGTGDANANHCTMVYIAGLQFDFNSAGQDETPTENRRGINIYNSDNIFVERCEIHHAWQEALGFGNFGTPATRGNYAVVRDCYFHDNAQDDINPNIFNAMCINNRHYKGNIGIEAGIDYFTAIGNDFDDYDGAAIAISCLNQFVVSGNRMNDCEVENFGYSYGTINIAGGGTAAPSQNGVIANNVIINSVTHVNQRGIHSSRGTSTSDHNKINICQNVIRGIQIGIYPTSLKDSLISGNLVSDCAYGIVIPDTAQVTDNRVIDNYGLDNSTDDILDQSADSRNNVVTNNWATEGLQKATVTVTATGPTDNVDVRGIETVFVNTASNNVTIGGFINGESGQSLDVVVINATNNTTLEHAEATGNQDIYLKSGGDETLTATLGGWRLKCNGTHWYEVRQ